MLATEAADQLRHRVGGEGGEAGEIEVSGHQPGDRRNGGGGVLDVAEGLPSRTQQGLAGHGEAGAGPRSDEQRGAELLLQLADRERHGGLGHVLGLGGGREAALLRHRHEQPQPPKIHRKILW